jgi:mannosyltransferase
MTAVSTDVQTAAAEPAASWTDGPLHWIALAAALVTSVALALPGFDVLYRFDEVQSVVIADRPLWDVPAALRLDGAPPLYYLILDVWMKVFGTSPAATYSLSTIFGLGTIMAVWWLGTRLAGPAAGVLAAWLVAANPFFVPFMAETRNYTLFALLGVLAVGFGDAAVHDGRRGDVVRFGITLAALLYTHAWGLFLVGAIILCLGAWSGASSPAQ